MKHGRTPKRVRHLPYSFFLLYHAISLLPLHDDVNSCGLRMSVIIDAYRHRGYDKGARGIYMRLLHMDPPVHMNIKKIRRLMKKYGLFCPIRKANPYRRAAKAIKTASAAPNLLNREFEMHGPRKVLLTDITYLINGKAPRCYMPTVLDSFT